MTGNHEVLFKDCDGSRRSYESKAQSPEAGMGVKDSIHSIRVLISFKLFHHFELYIFKKINLNLVLCVSVCRYVSTSDYGGQSIESSEAGVRSSWEPSDMGARM